MMREAIGETLFENVLDDLTVFVSRLDRDLNLLFANRAYIAEFAPDASLEKMRGQNILAYFVDDRDRQAFVEALAALTPEHPVHKSRIRERRSDGTLRIYDWTNRALFDGGSRVKGYQTVGQDVTAEVQALEALQRSEQRFRSIIDQQTELVSRHNRDFVCTFGNRAYAEMFSPTGDVEPLLGRSVIDYQKDPARRAAFEASLRSLTPENPATENLLYEDSADGSKHWIHWNNRALFDSTGELTEYQAVGRDVTREIESRNALIAILSGALDGIVEFGADWSVKRCNPAATRMFGWDAANGPTGRQPLNCVNPRTGEPEPISDLIQRNLAEMLTSRREIAGLRVDDTPFPVELSLVDAGEGGAPRHVAFFRDLTEQRALEGEIERQRRAVAQTEKLSALGSLLANVAHELNNPLSVVVTQADMLADKASDAATAKRATRIKRAASRCGDIVRTFLSIARQDPASQEAFAAKDVAEDAISLVDHALTTSGVTLEIDLGDNLPPLYGDPVQIGQVLSNLLVNGQQALMEQAAPRHLRFTGVRTDASVRFIISDNGPGVNADLCDRIFEPFFTTKPEGSGTGIGLAIARSIAVAHGGYLELAESEIGGATFVLSLPSARREAISEAAKPDESRSTADTPHVLIVDDESDVAESLAELLEDAGFASVIAIGGSAALDVIERHRVDAIISDIRMPDMDGPSLYRQIQTRKPDLASRFGILTGDMLSPVAKRFLANQDVPRLAKPFSRDDALDFARALTAR